MRRVRVFLFVLLAVLYGPALVEAQSKTPCLSKDARGRWRVLKGTSCVLYSVADFRKIVDRLAQLEHYKKVYEPACEVIKGKYRTIDLTWKRSAANWALQVKHYGNIVSYQQKEAKVWRDAFLKLKRQKVPKPHWTESPALWYTLGVITVLAVGGITAGIILASRPTTTQTARKPLLIPQVVGARGSLRRESLIGRPFVFQFKRGL